MFRNTYSLTREPGGNGGGMEISGALYLKPFLHPTGDDTNQLNLQQELAITPQIYEC